MHKGRQVSTREARKVKVTGILPRKEMFTCLLGMLGMDVGLQPGDPLPASAQSLGFAYPRPFYLSLASRP